MLKWSSKAKVALRKLFEAMQEIDVYVEDENDEAFYRCLFRFATNDEVKIKRVFSLGGRDNVINAAIEHDYKKRRALFIVDGDLPWVKGENQPLPPGVHCHNAYCVENLLLCKLALATLVSQENAVVESDAVAQLDFEKWKVSVHNPLVELFAAFATCHDFAPSIPTVSRGVSAVVTVDPKTKVTALDLQKVVDLKDTVLDAASVIEKKEKVLARYNERLAIIKKKTNPIDAVSGKDFLLPLVHFHLSTLGCRIQKKSLRIRLASTGDTARLKPLANALKNAAHGVAEHV